MNKEALEVLKNRRSIRKFKAQQIANEELEAVLQAGTYAPTAMGSQSPVIVAVQDPATVAKLDEMNAKVIGSNKMPHPYYGAPTILLVIAPKGAALQTENCSLVSANLLNAAYAVGLGSCWINRSEEMFETPEGQALLKQWGLPDNMRCVSSIALGYADCPQPEPAPRKADYIIKV